MAKYEIQKVYAFSSPEGGGNPAGVLIGAESLSEDQMQAIAKEVGFSETAFVSASSVANFKLDFFTPNRRIPDCGHATVAAFSVLKEKFPKLSKTSKEIVSGIRKILIKDGRVYMEQPLASIVSLADPRKVIKDMFGADSGITRAWLI